MSDVIAPTRADAKKGNVPLYHGVPCCHCGSTVRRTWNFVCRTCNDAYQRAYKAKNRLERDKGVLTYQGKPCLHCGGTERIRSNCECVRYCQRKAYRKARAGK